MNQSENQSKRIVRTIETDKVHRLRALVYHLANEQMTLDSIREMLKCDYEIEDIDNAYGRRNKLPRYSTRVGE